MLKFTIGFVSGRYSWTESHLNTATSSPAGSNTHLIAQALAARRAACLGVGAAISRIRVSDQPANRIVYDYLPPDIASTGFTSPSGLVPGSAVYNAEVSGLCLVVNIYDPLGRPTRVFVAGLPAGLFTEPSVANLGYNFSQVPLLQTMLDSYFGYLTGPNNGWGFATRVLGLFLQATGPLVTNAAYPGAVGVTLPQQLNFGTQLRPQVVAKGWRRFSTRSPGLSGVYYVQGAPLFNAGPPQSWTYFLANTGSVLPTNFFTIGGLYVYNPTITAYDSFEYDEATTRKRGSRFAAPRGRSSIRT